ncbi:MAG: DUF47 family protein [Sterolibacteriaceae bacterium]|nr:DUF47 family protein [Sterolibacteriaceae bacterium]
MTDKTRIIDALGEPKLLLPALVNEALAANDRAKYYFALLQIAQARADDPQRSAPELVAERSAAGVEEDALDTVPAHSARLEAGRYCIPQVSAVCARLGAELATMLDPLHGAGADSAGEFSARLAALKAEPWCAEDDTISAIQIARLTSGSREQGDSAHLLVMDMHKALNALQAGIASDNIDGAAAYEIGPDDRGVICAFMRGLNGTRALKFDHPGLGTTATRAGDRLVLQNDIGTTDAHVLVIHVIERSVTLTYTDVHIQRLLFFQSLFEHWAVRWEDTRSRTDRNMEDGVYHLCVGKFTANSEAGLTDYLAFLGSRLVFLIDWNRARKRLRLLLPKRETMALLKWAADQDIGHMAWLCAGGEQLIFDALSFAAKSPPAFGARLDDMLELRKAVGFMQFVLRTCSQGMLQNRTHELYRDEIRAELVSWFRSAQQQLLDLAAEHAALSIEIAAGVRDCLLDLHGADAAERIERNAQRARDWEHRADELVNQARGLNQHAERVEFYRNLIEVADDIADELEEAAFHLTLLPRDAADGALHEALYSLAALSVSGAQEYLKALETARSVRRGGPREDTQDFLESIHRIMAAERQSDDAQRAVKRAMVAQARDFRELYAFAECARSLEAAADALMHTGLQLRDYVLGTMASE